MAGLRGEIQPPDATAGRVLLASVVDSRNRPLVTVGPDDFLITEGGQPREVLDVHVADYPVVLIVDDGPEAQADPTLPSIRAAAARFIGRIGQRPVAVGRLSSADGFAAGFDDERAEVLQRVGELEVSPATPVPLASVAHAAATIREIGSPFSAIVVVTSRPGGNVDAATAEQLPGILESGVTIHVIGSRPGSAAAGAAPDLWRGLAEQTHGQYTPIYATASFAIALDRLADRMAAEMMIEYLVPPGPPAGDVRVGARIPGAKVAGLGVR